MKLAALPAVLIAATFQTGPWLSGLDQIRDAMSQHYANLEWVVGVRHVDLQKLYTKTRADLDAATSSEQARKALDSFSDGVDDGHVWIDWSDPLQPEVNASGAPQDLCTTLGYGAMKLHPGIDFASTGRYDALSSPASRYFETGVLRLNDGIEAGLIRIPIFGAYPYHELCDRALPALRLRETSSCDDVCSDAVEIAADDALTRQYERALRTLTQGRHLAMLIVDITRNGGGSSWLEPAARELTMVPLKSPRLGFIEHPHWVTNFRDALASIDVALPSASPEYRTLLLEARDTYRIAERHAAATCDRSPLWDDRPIDCSLVVTAVPLTTSGTLAYAKPGALPRERATTYIFQPSLYHYTEGLYRGKLVVLIDDHTVSSAERFAAVLQDAGAATIAGVHSYGAGCGFTNGGIPTKIDAIGADVHLPDCIQLRADGTNAVAGITPDLAIAWHNDDTPTQKAQLALDVLANAAADPPVTGGKALVDQKCTQCHTLERVENSGYSREGWSNVVAMMKNLGAKISPDEAAAIVAYLAQTYPERDEPRAAIVPGSVKVTIREWLVPTPGARPHDPLAMPDGSIWYSGQLADVLGRLDPTTGAIKQYPLPPNSGPHGLVNDGSGNIWYTANFAGYIGKLDPSTGAVTKYPMPDPAARDPHTPVFDAHGTLWFTVQSGNFVGRLDPSSGAIHLIALPHPSSLPYGMVISSKGVPFFDEFGANRIGRIDPQTMAIHEYVLPAADARPRRIAKTAGDVIWYTDYARGYLGRLDPVTGAVTEWASPSGPKSKPYAIAQLDGVIWYSESGVTPNTIVRFDPSTHRFQTWAIPSGGGVVRNMMPTRDGNLAIACSGMNRVGLVIIR